MKTAVLIADESAPEAIDVRLRLLALRAQNPERAASISVIGPGDSLAAEPAFDACLLIDPSDARCPQLQTAILRGLYTFTGSPRASTFDFQVTAGPAPATDATTFALPEIPANGRTALRRRAERRSRLLRDRTVRWAATDEPPTPSWADTLEAEGFAAVHDEIDPDVLLVTGRDAADPAVLHDVIGVVSMGGWIHVTGDAASVLGPLAVNELAEIVGDRSLAGYAPLPRYDENPAPDGVNDWLFVTPKESKGWILDAICREIGQRHPGTWEVNYNTKRLPRARNYFFSHYWIYLDGLKRNPHIMSGRTFVWYTHPREIPYAEDAQLEGYGAATRMIFTCSQFRDDWVQRGLPATRAEIVLGGADPTLFRPHERGQGAVGLSSSYYERKNPRVLVDLVRAMPHRRFHLVGRNWEQYAGFDELRSLPNFTYETVPYEQYPAIYEGFDVFLSLATLEGGPIPLLETMMCNAVPVASRTGFAPDLITHGANGFIFDVGAGADIIAPLIEQAFAMTTDVAATVADYSWDQFAERILSFGDAPAATA